MLWRNHLCTAASLALLSTGLAGCGFHPLYADQAAPGAVGPALASVKVEQVHDRLGQALTNQLRDDFNPTSAGVAAQYRLEVAITRTILDQAGRTDGTASHTSVRISANYALRRLSDNQAVTTGNVRTQNGFDVTDNQYGNTIAQQTQELRAVHELGDQIAGRVALYFQQTAAKP
jgi:LPS-assembly lipoprotein